MNSAPHSSSCLTITFPLQSNNNLNTNRREAFQKVMNSEALEPRQAWFKCRAPATQRGYQLYSLPSRKQKSYFKESLPERERKWRKCHRNHTTQSKQFQENRWVAKSCQRQPSPPRGKKRQDTVTSLLFCPSFNSPEPAMSLFSALFSITPGALGMYILNLIAHSWTFLSA